MVGSSNQNQGQGQNTSGSPKINYNTPPSLVANQINDGDQFILVKRSRQGDEPQVWTSGDQQQTQQMFRDLQAHVQVGSLESTT